jgi:hypothetical protein
MAGAQPQYAVSPQTGDFTASGNAELHNRNMEAIRTRAFLHRGFLNKSRAALRADRPDPFAIQLRAGSSLRNINVPRTTTKLPIPNISPALATRASSTTVSAVSPIAKTASGTLGLGTGFIHIDSASA